MTRLPSSSLVYPRKRLWFTCSLLIAVSTNSTVRRDSEFRLCILLTTGITNLSFGRDDHYISHQITSLSIRLYKYSACFTGLSKYSVISPKRKSTGAFFSGISLNLSLRPSLVDLRLISLPAAMKVSLSMMAG